MAESDPEDKLTSLLNDLETYFDTNPIQPANKKINKFRYKHILELQIYDEIVSDSDPLRLLYGFFTPNNIFEILSDIQLEKKKIDCFTARNVYNLIEKVYIYSWIKGIRKHHSGNYKLMALGASTIRAVMRVVIRELISDMSGKHGIVDGIIESIGDCKSEKAYNRDASLYEGTCRKNSNKYTTDPLTFLNDYEPPRDNCPDINDLLKKKKEGMSMSMPDEDPRWLIIVEGALGTNTFYNYAANFMEKVFSVFHTSSPDNFTPPKKKKSVSKGRKIVSKLKQARSGGRKTTKHNKNSRKYK